MPPPPDVSGYRLSDEQSTAIFTNEILPAEFPASANPPCAETPIAVLAVGQTGAGKTVLARDIVHHFSSLQPAHFIADTYKTYHPEYTRLMLSNPSIASPATGSDARKWLEMAAKEAVGRRRHVLIESACRHPDDFCQLVKIFAEAKYRVHVILMAVPEALSRLGILIRFYQKLPEGQSRGLPVRLTPVKVHNDSYAGLIYAAKFLDDTKLAHQVIVVRRGSLVAFGGAGDGGAEKAVVTERKRPLSKDEMKRALDDVQTLSTHEDAAEQVSQIRELLKPLLEGDAESGGFPKLEPLLISTAGSDGSNVLNLSVYLQ